MKLFKVGVFFLHILFTATFAFTQKKSLVISGPMLGNVELRTAEIWIQLQEGYDETVISYWKKGASRTHAKRLIHKKEASTFPNIFKFKVNELEPANAYQYSITLSRDAIVLGSGEFTTQDLWQYRKPAPDFSFLTGSCAYFNEPIYDRPGKPYGGDSSIFESMAREKNASFMLWLGDNWYTREADFYSEWGLSYRPSRDRSLAVLQPFLKNMSHYAIWDDHDYGPNGSDKSFVLKDASRKVFMDYWSNPSYGENGQGIYSKVAYNDVEIFLMDDRWFRSNDETPDSINGRPNAEKKMYGEQQMEWFKNAMRQSNSNRNVHFRIIATGSQVLNPVSPYDCFRHFPLEYKEMMDFLENEKINGVIFFTGDRHNSEVIKKERKGSYPLYDVTCSALTSGSYTFSGPEKNNPYRVAAIENKQNYGRVTISGKGADRKMSVEFKGIKGEKLGEWSVSLKDISDEK